MFKVFNVAASGMSAQNQRLNLVASNMANADAVSSSIDQTYKSRQPFFRTLQNQLNPDDPTVGVKMAGVVESQAPLVSEYNPHHPMANEDGYIFRPNVNLVEEMANMISASRSYQSNIEVVNSAKRMATQTLQMGKGN
ncbi:MAG: flagellar basal body rod protein FlgC [Gammaproteobacteria bacterium]|nr:flagellar basal body rod protein FlgC [Gammaproteobacteria bacterium]